MVSDGRRSSVIEQADIVRVGRELGMRNLSLGAVAKSLGVSSAALYRHVDGRWGLECLIGEDILSEFEVPPADAERAEEYLLALAMSFYRFTASHPGLASYVQTLFPRGKAGNSLLAAASSALDRYGYDQEVGVVLATAVGTLAIGYASAADDRRARLDGLAQQRARSLSSMHSEGPFAEAIDALPEVPDDEYVQLWIGAAIDGFVEAAPAGMPALDVLASMRRRYGGTGAGSSRLTGDADVEGSAR